MTKKLRVEQQHKKTHDPQLVSTVTSPEALSASVLTICRGIEPSYIHDMVDELRKQTAAVHGDDLSRAESMLMAQAHTLDGLFARPIADALTSSAMDKMERYMKLGLKAQNQARATLQTLSELKHPKQVAFVKQANIGNQVQVNNDSNPTRTRKNKKAPNELLEAEHGERMDTRAASPASRADPAKSPMGAEFRPQKR